MSAVKTVLIIDDESAFRKLLQKQLQQYGYCVLEAADGDTGLQVYRQYRPALVITDLIMPGKEGLETIRELRKLNPKVHIIAVSGGGLVSPVLYLGLAKKLGTDHVLEKPFAQDDLMSLLRKILPHD